MKILYLFFFLLLLLGGCQNEEQVAGEAFGEQDTFEHPDTPEEVVRQYQYYVDNNKFAYAKRLSTPAEQEMLDYLSDMVSGQPTDSTILHTEFISIVCKKAEATADCIGVIQEDGEKTELMFKVVKIDGKWLVDTNEDDGELQYDSIEEDFSSDKEI